MPRRPRANEPLSEGTLAKKPSLQKHDQRRHLPMEGFSVGCAGERKQEFEQKFAFHWSATVTANCNATVEGEGGEGEGQLSLDERLRGCARASVASA